MNYDINGTVLPYNESTVFSASTIDKTNSSFWSEDDELPEINQFVQPIWQQLLWTFLFGGMILVATGGNLIVIWIVLAHRRMRTVTNYFLVNLSIADAMVSTLNVTFNFVYMLNSDWPFGHAFCKVSNFVAVLSVSASVFTLMAISVDRYLAIIFPLRPRMRRSTTLIIASSIWIVSSFLSFPNLLYSTTFVENFSTGGYRTICYMEWPDGPMLESNDEYVYNCVFMVLTYFLPILAMSFTYTRVGLELWGSRILGESTEKQIEGIKSKRRVVKMMIVVVIMFTICWLPYHIYFIVTYHYTEVTRSSYIQQVYLSIYWLAMSNSMYNPIIYCWMNSRFRHGFHRVFCCLCSPSSSNAVQRNRWTTSRYSCHYSPDQSRRNGTVVVPLTEITRQDKENRRQTTTKS